ncbi:LysR family transcriptional regulator [Billgrantia tianxiuensis]|jgi:DNA-binding transcriptional LysR family regulator|uniref:LysR family transcriptional regulator n=1 Tax=Billgrantia tianxiuensis TaxID=2497861 RepID=A0A6I6SMS0_9GAMM|nr:MULTISPECIES: LysR family transcriptional regulator [Halomonas]MCE8032121.1 LysR family transcriptional regulator [Halomonas sp. MCCC 1A11057]QHC49846.1 LysR family transcriptional regulator [Halomonas tianxiuensis]
MNLFNAMQCFCRIVELGSFAHAATALGISSAQVSKQIHALESHLKVRLLNRTTRKVSPTEIGTLYYERCQRILKEINELESLVEQQDKEPQGVLKISAPVDFSTMYLMDAFTSFQRSHPKIQLDINLNDNFVSLIEDGLDVAIRVGELPDSALIARRLATTFLGYYASPVYLRQYGEPKNLEQLAEHQTLRYMVQGREFPSPLQKSSWTISCNNGRAMCEAAAKGAGIIIKPNFLAMPFLQDGTLVEILKQHRRQDVGIYAVYLHRNHVPCKIIEFVDCLADHLRHNDVWNRVHDGRGLTMP